MIHFTFKDFKQLVNDMPSEGETIAMTVGGQLIDRMNDTPWYVLTCPDCGRKQIYVGTGLYQRPNCIDCDHELVPSTNQSTAQKLAVIARIPELQEELGFRISETMYGDSVTDETLGRAVADTGYAAVMDIGHNSGIAAANMFAAIVNMDLDDLIDTMQPVSHAEKG